MSEHDWFNFLLGIVVANQVWLLIVFLVIVPKMRDLQIKADVAGKP